MGEALVPRRHEKLRPTPPSAFFQDVPEDLDVMGSVRFAQDGEVLLGDVPGFFLDEVVVRAPFIAAQHGLQFPGGLVLEGRLVHVLPGDLPDEAAAKPEPGMVADLPEPRPPGRLQASFQRRALPGDPHAPVLPDVEMPAEIDGGARLRIAHPQPHVNEHRVDPVSPHGRVDIRHRPELTSIRFRKIIESLCDRRLAQRDGKNLHREGQGMPVSPVLCDVHTTLVGSRRRVRPDVYRQPVRDGSTRRDVNRTRSLQIGRHVHDPDRPALVERSSPIVSVPRRHPW